MIKPGEAVKFLMTAAEGGFSFEQLPMSLSDLILRVDHMEPAILYSRTFRMNRAGVENKQLVALMLLGVVREEKGEWKRH